MRLDGELSVRLRLTEGQDNLRVAGTELASTRPHLVSRVLLGRAAEEVVALVPRLFVLCGRAQGIAAALACEAAAGIETTSQVTEARRLLVGVEMLQEGLWRTMIDWPTAVDEKPMIAQLAATRQALDAVLPEIAVSAGLAPSGTSGGAVEEAKRTARAVAADGLSQQVLGTTCAHWHSLDTPEALANWSGAHATPAAKLLSGIQHTDAALGACAVALLPPVAGDSAAATLAPAIEADAAFARAPHWKGNPAETGPLARMQAQPLVAAVVRRFGRSALARFVARLDELCGFASGSLPAMGGRRLGPGRGIAWVETSRGLLLHHAELESGQVQQYRIVAPTEWNFHPQGALVRGLEGGTFANEAALRRGVDLLVQSLDPCVSWKLELAHA